MTFVKLVKNKAYFMRYQTKYRRRRESKTDYYARKRLTVNAKNKYNQKKYRLVVRFTNRYVICQIVYSEIDGDKVMASAYSSELPRYGVECGLKNYSAAYCTGLLVARRVLTKLGLDEIYDGIGEEEVDGEVVTVKEGKKTYYVAEVDEEKKPFRCNLDVGLKATTPGSKIFAALKGAVDGGLDIPHSAKLFHGYDLEAEKGEEPYDPEVMRDMIVGAGVEEYMEKLEEEEEEYAKQFKCYVDAGVTKDDLEDMYLQAHTKIREDPSPAPKKDKSVYKTEAYTKYAKAKKITREQRRANVKAKLAAAGIDME